jgi:hypothetical protein
MIRGHNVAHALPRRTGARGTGKDAIKYSSMDRNRRWIWMLFVPYRRISLTATG